MTDQTGGPTPLPAAWVDRIHGRLKSIYGESFDPGPKTEWSVSLGWLVHCPDAVAGVLKAIANNPAIQPTQINPDSFGRMCRAAIDAAPAGAPVQPNRDPTEDGVQALERVSSLAKRERHAEQSDGLAWARRPKSALAVTMLVQASEKSIKARNVLSKLLAGDGSECRSDEARKALAYVRSNPPWWADPSGDPLDYLDGGNHAAE